MPIDAGHAGPGNDDISIDIANAPVAAVIVNEQQSIRRAHGCKRGIEVHKAGRKAIPQRLLSAAVSDSLHGATENRIYIALAGCRRSKSRPVTRKVHLLVVNVSADRAGTGCYSCS